MNINKKQKIVIAALVILLLGFSSAAYFGGLVKHIEVDELEGGTHIYTVYPRNITDAAGRNVTNR